MNLRPIFQDMGLKIDNIVFEKMRSSFLQNILTSQLISKKSLHIKDPETFEHRSDTDTPLTLLEIIYQMSTKRFFEKVELTQVAVSVSLSQSCPFRITNLQLNCRKDLPRTTQKDRKF